MADRVAWTQPQLGGQGFAGTQKRFGTAGAVALVVGDLVINKTVGLFMVPKGFVLTSISATVTDLDTGGSPALTIDLGDSGDPDRFVAAATTGQAGGTTTTLASTGIRYEFTADTEIVWTTHAASATAAAGTVTVDFFGYMK